MYYSPQSFPAVSMAPGYFGGPLYVGIGSPYGSWGTGMPYYHMGYPGYYYGFHHNEHDWNGNGWNNHEWNGHWNGHDWNDYD